jgi:hypothetical protein
MPASENATLRETGDKKGVCAPTHALDILTLVSLTLCCTGLPTTTAESIATQGAL